MKSIKLESYIRINFVKFFTSNSLILKFFKQRNTEQKSCFRQFSSLIIFSCMSIKTHTIHAQIKKNKS